MRIVTLTIGTGRFSIGGRNYSLEIQFPFDEEGTNETIVGEDNGIYVQDWGDTTISREIDSPSLTTTMSKVRIIDLSSYIYNNLFQNTSLNWQRIFVKMVIDGVTEYDGYIISDSIEFIFVEKIFKFRVTPMIAGLNEASIEQIPDGWMDFDDALLYCYRSVIPGLTTADIDLNHDWEFYASHYNSASAVWEIVNGISLAAVRINVRWYCGLNNIKTIGEFLRKLCQIFYAKTGTYKTGKVFFSKYSQSSGVTPKVIDANDRINFKIGGQQKYKSVEVNYAPVPAGVPLPGAGPTTPMKFIYGDINDTSERYTVDLGYWTFWGLQGSVQRFESFLKVTIAGSTGEVFATDYNMNTYFVGEVLAANLYDHFQLWRQEVELTVKGVDYLFTDGFVLPGYLNDATLWPVYMKKDYQQNRTRIKLIK